MQTAKANNALVVTMNRFCTNIKWFGPFFERGARNGIIAEIKVSGQQRAITCVRVRAR
jgi:hypothetical protein